MLGVAKNPELQRQEEIAELRQRIKTLEGLIAKGVNIGTRRKLDESITGYNQRLAELGYSGRQAEKKQAA